LIVPTPPALYDFSSTVQYFRMIQTVIDSIVPDKEYNFIKILASRVDGRKSTHEEFLTYMQHAFENCMLDAKLEQATEIEKLSAKFKTIYDVNSNKKTQRVQNIFDSVCSEIEQEILKWWPSLIKRRVKDEAHEKEEVLENG
jgi:chromosome partitioning protein